MLLAADAVFFMILRHSSLSSHVLCISMFVISVHLLKLFMYLVMGSSLFHSPYSVLCIIFVMMYHV